MDYFELFKEKAKIYASNEFFRAPDNNSHDWERKIKEVTTFFDREITITYSEILHTYVEQSHDLYNICNAYLKLLDKYEELKKFEDRYFNRGVIKGFFPKDENGRPKLTFSENKEHKFNPIFNPIFNEEKPNLGIRDISKDENYQKNSNMYFFKQQKQEEPKLTFSETEDYKFFKPTFIERREEIKEIKEENDGKNTSKYIPRVNRRRYVPKDKRVVSSHHTSVAESRKREQNRSDEIMKDYKRPNYKIPYYTNEMMEQDPYKNEYSSNEDPYKNEYISQEYPYKNDFLVYPEQTQLEEHIMEETISPETSKFYSEDEISSEELDDIIVTKGNEETSSQESSTQENSSKETSFKESSSQESSSKENFSEELFI